MRLHTILVLVLCAATPLSPLLAASADYDGTWKATVSCGPNVYHDPAWSKSFDVTITSGKFAYTDIYTVKNPNKAAPITHTVKWDGQIEGDSLEVTGKESTDDIVMLPSVFAFKGSMVSVRKAISTGTLSQTSAGLRLGSQIAGCKFELLSRTPAPESLAAGDQQGLNAASPGRGSRDYDGTWDAAVSCTASATNPPFSYNFQAVIARGYFEFRRVTREGEYVNTALLEGYIREGELTVSVNGSSTAILSPAWKYTFAGRAGPSRRFSLSGDYTVNGIKRRDCTFELSPSIGIPLSK